MSFQILKEGDRYALYQDGVLVNTYSRKDSATRRLKRILELSNKHCEPLEEAETVSVAETGSGQSNVYALPITYHTFTLVLFTPKQSNRSVGLPCQQTQCALAHGAVGMVARSPP